MEAGQKKKGEEKMERWRIFRQSRQSEAVFACGKAVNEFEAERSCQEEFVKSL